MSESQDRCFSECEMKISKSRLIDEKLTLAIEFMKEALSDGEKARFRDFWRMKKICLELFKSEIHKVKRVAYWEEYTTLLTQAHGLQRIIEEQMSFQSEQISLAIEGLEKEYENHLFQAPSKELQIVAKLENGKELIALEIESTYTHKLREQALLYRKEILSLEIRISQKNKLLSKLSKVSDKIFPKRKKLLNHVTDLFSQSIEQFVQKYFNLEEKVLLGSEANYKIRDEIKLFQAALRGLTLTNDAYQRIRKTLGKCWDVLSAAEKERRGLFQLRKDQAPTEVKDELEALMKLQNFAQFEKSSEILIENATKRNVSKEAVFLLKKEISKRQSNLESKLVNEKVAFEVETQKRKEKNEQTYIDALDSLDNLKSKAVRMKLENVEEQLEKVLSLNMLSVKCGRKSVVFNHKKQLVERILIEKREKSGQKVQESYVTLHAKMKNSIDLLRKAKTESSLDFEFAIEISGYLEEGKEALEVIEGKF